MQIYKIAEEHPGYQDHFVTVLPYVYTSSASDHFEEQLVLVLDTICRWPTTRIEHTRARVCIIQLREASLTVLRRLQCMHNCVCRR